MKLQESNYDARPNTPRDFKADNKDNDYDEADEDEDDLKFEIDSNDSFHKMMKEQKDKQLEKENVNAEQEVKITEQLFRADKNDK